MSAYNNTITIVGNVGRDPEIRETEAGHVATFSVAVYRSGKGESKKTDWFYIEAWHDLARGCENLRTGDKVIIYGSMKFEQYEKEGIKVNSVRLVAREIGKSIAIKEDEIF